MAMVQYKSGDVSCLEDIIRKIDVSEFIGKKRILNVSAAFDTEVTSFFHEQSGEQVALVYIWMFGISNAVIYGRTLDEFKEFIYILNDYLEKNNVKLIVYIHNMKYDFQFIRTLFNWDTVFMKAKRNPLYARTGNIEFRDSLILAGNRSLAYIGKHLKSHNINKATGDLNYNLWRHYLTPLTDKELHYCEYDIRVLTAYIDEKIEEEGDITKIPYTNTGYVRRYIKNACLSEHGNRYRAFMDNLTLTPGAYQQCESAFVGGAVGANNNKVGRVIENVISYDIKSSYPYVMVTGDFPMGYPEPVRNSDARSYLSMNQFCCIFRLHIYDLAPKEGNNYCYPISQDKCRNLIGARIVANRVVSAAYCVIECTELDYDTFAKFYDLSSDNTRITNMRVYPKGKLPAPIRLSILEFFNKKTTLDGVEGMESEYMISKNMLNSIYGMMVERPVRPKYSYLSMNDSFEKTVADYTEQVEDYNEKRDRVLYYPWGVYVTALARHRLYDAIATCGDRYVYCDTDSVKWQSFGESFDERIVNYFERVNKEARNEIENAAKSLGISLDYAIPRDPKGEQKVLGVWENEYTAVKFKTLGAKRYLYEDQKGKRHLTVAGTNKASTLEYLELQEKKTGKSIFILFDDNLVIPKEYAKRLIATYIDEEVMGYMTDYLGNRAFYSAPSGVHMVPSSYTFTLSDSLRDEIFRIAQEEELDFGKIEE